MEITKTVTETSFTINLVRSPKDLKATIELFEEYAESLNIDLSFQSFADEMSSMPGKYTPPKGALYLAKDTDEEPIGCIGLRPATVKGCCEIKRLYVAESGRGLGTGKALAETAIDEARRLGYQAILLDTLGTMTTARKLYRVLGFEEIDAYYDTPIEGSVFMKLDLTNKRRQKSAS